MLVTVLNHKQNQHQNFSCPSESRARVSVELKHQVMLHAYRSASFRVKVIRVKLEHGNWVRTLPLINTTHEQQR